MSAVLERIISNTVTNGVKPHLITASEYDRMIEAGIYTENDRIELLNGEIIEIIPKRPKHVYFNEAIAELFREKFGKKVDVRSQNPIEAAMSLIWSRFPKLKLIGLSLVIMSEPPAVAGGLS